MMVHGKNYTMLLLKLGKMSTKIEYIFAASFGLLFPNISNFIFYYDYYYFGIEIYTPENIRKSLCPSFHTIVIELSMIIGAFLPVLLLVLGLLHIFKVYKPKILTYVILGCGIIIYFVSFFLSPQFAYAVD